MIRTTHTVLGVALAASFLLAGCGPESTTAKTSSTASTSTSSEASNSDQQGPGGNSEQFEEIQACLKKAGLEDKLPQRGEKRDSSERPSAPPSGEPQGVDGKAGGPFADEEVQAALKACGIDVPERPNGPGQQANQS